MTTYGYRRAINDVLQVHRLSQHGLGWGLTLSAGSLPSFYFPIKTKHPINLIHLRILLEGSRLEVKKKKKEENYHCWWTQMGSHKLMTVTVTANYRLHLPCRTSPWMASLPALSVCFPSAHRKEVSREKSRLLAVWEGPGPRWDLCVWSMYTRHRICLWHIIEEEPDPPCGFPPLTFVHPYLLCHIMT